MPGVEGEEPYMAALAWTPQKLRRPRTNPPDLLLPVVGVREEYLETALARVAQMGGMNAYLEHLGVSEETREQLRDRLIE